MRTRLFLRTTEFLWQEGHTAHATKNEAIAHMEAEQMLRIYGRVCRGMDGRFRCCVGCESPNERFVGAVEKHIVLRL